MKTAFRFMTLAAALAMPVAMVGCGDGDAALPPDPKLAKPTTTTDDAAKKAGDEAKKAGDAAGDALHNAGDALKDATH